MLAKKSRNNSVFAVEMQGLQTTSMPKLQQLTTLQTELMGILGRKNISIDQDNDIFTRLQELYLNYLQNQTLGLNLLQKCLLIVGDIDVPIRVNFLYYFAHQMKLRGAALDEVEPVLLNCFWSNLNLKKKLQLGFKSGLVFCQISQHIFEIIKIINNLIVALEEELNQNSREVKKIKSKSVSHSRLRVQTIKSIYVGNNLVQKNPLKLKNSVMPKRIELSLYLYQAYITGITKVDSQTKKRYYYSRMQQLKKRLIRQYPGYNIQNRLSYIENNEYLALKEFNQVIGINDFSQNCKKDKAKTESSSFGIERKISEGRINSKTLGQSSLKISYSHSLKNSFIRQVKSSKRTGPLKLDFANTQSGASKMKKINLQLYRRSKSKIQKNGPDCVEVQTKIPQKPKQEKKFHISRLIFRQNADNKGLVLKFDKLQEKQNGSKGEMKKKKIKNSFHWQEKPQIQKQKNVPEVTIKNEECILKVKEQIQKIESKSEIKIQLPKTVEKISQNPKLQIFASAPFPSISNIISINKIDLLIQEALSESGEKTSQQQLQLKKIQTCKPIVSQSIESNEQLNHCQSRIEEKLLSYNDSFSQTYQLNSVNELINLRQIKQQIQEREPSYKIVIMKQTGNSIKNQQQTINQDNFLQNEFKILQERQQNSHERLVNVFREETNTMMENINKQICQHLVLGQHNIPKIQYLVPQNIFNYMETEIQQNLEFANKTKDDPLFYKLQLKQSQNFTKNKDRLMLSKKQEQQNNIQNECDIFDIVDSWLHNMQIQIENNLPLIDLNQGENLEIDEYLQDLYTSIEFLVILQPDKSSSLLGPDILDTQTDKNESSQSIILKKQANEKQDQMQNNNNKIDSWRSSNQSSELPIIKHPLKSLNTSCNEILDADLNINDQNGPSHLGLPPCSGFLISMIDANENDPMDWKSQSNFFSDLFVGNNIKQGAGADYNYLNIPAAKEKPLNEMLYDKINDQIIETPKYINKIQKQLKTGSIEKALGIIDPIEKQKNMDKMFDIKINMVDSKEIKKKMCLNNPLISLSFNENDTITQYGKRIQHWLNPDIKISNKEIMITIHRPNSNIIYEKRYQIDFVSCLKDELFKMIDLKLEEFLDNYQEDDYKLINQEIWNNIVQDLENLNIFPDQVDLKIVQLEDKTKDIVYNITFQRKIKDNLVIASCSNPKISCYPIDIAENGGIDHLSELISPENIIINNDELLFHEIWTLIAQRNIKFKDKYQQKAIHYIFNIYQNCVKGEPIRFNYYVHNSDRTLNMKFQCEGLDIRQKITKNIETIIGYCLKQISPNLVIFDYSGIHKFLKLL